MLYKIRLYAYEYLTRFANWVKPEMTSDDLVDLLAVNKNFKRVRKAALSGRVTSDHPEVRTK